VYVTTGEAFPKVAARISGLMPLRFPLAEKNLILIHKNKKPGAFCFLSVSLSTVRP
jgi:hypothetical protein